MLKVPSPEEVQRLDFVIEIQARSANEAGYKPRFVHRFKRKEFTDKEVYTEGNQLWAIEHWYSR